MFSRITSHINKKTRGYSCRANSFMISSPTIASLVTGFFFSSILISRMHSNDTQLMTKLYEIEKQIKDLKGEKEVKQK